MVADSLFLTVWSVWLEDLRRAGFAYADKGLITLRSRNWSLLILPCLGRGRLLCEISRACRIAAAHLSIAPQCQPASLPNVSLLRNQTASLAWGGVGRSAGWGQNGSALFQRKSASKTGLTPPHPVWLWGDGLFAECCCGG